MSDALYSADGTIARYTKWGTFVSVPLLVARNMAGVAVYADTRLAWDTLRGIRQAHADRKHGRYASLVNGRQYIDADGESAADGFRWDALADADGVWNETGGRGYFPSPDGFDDVNETVNAVMDSFDPWAQERNERHNASNRAHNVRAERIMAQIGFPPMSGGSPWAARDTGWHADGCLCRSCR